MEKRVKIERVWDSVVWGRTSQLAVSENRRRHTCLSDEGQCASDEKSMLCTTHSNRRGEVKLVLLAGSCHATVRWNDSFAFSFINPMLLIHMMMKNSYFYFNERIEYWFLRKFLAQWIVPVDFQRFRFRRQQLVAPRSNQSIFHPTTNWVRFIY